MKEMVRNFLNCLVALAATIIPADPSGSLISLLNIRWQQCAAGQKALCGKCWITAHVSGSVIRYSTTDSKQHAQHMPVNFLSAKILLVHIEEEQINVMSSKSAVWLRHPCNSVNTSQNVCTPVGGHLNESPVFWALKECLDANFSPKAKHNAYQKVCPIHLVLLELPIDVGHIVQDQPPVCKVDDCDTSNASPYSQRGNPVTQ